MCLIYVEIPENTPADSRLKGHSWNSQNKVMNINKREPCGSVL